MLSKNLRVVGCGGVLLIKTQLDGRQQNQIVKWHIAYSQCLKERTDSAHSLLFVARWCSRADSSAVPALLAAERAVAVAVAAAATEPWAIFSVIAAPASKPFPAMAIKESAPELACDHILKSINETELIGYQDRAAKLRNHLPFATDYENNSV